MDQLEKRIDTLEAENSDDSFVIEIVHEDRSAGPDGVRRFTPFVPDGYTEEVGYPFSVRRPFYLDEHGQRHDFPTKKSQGGRDAE